MSEEDWILSFHLINQILFLKKNIYKLKFPAYIQI